MPPDESYLGKVLPPSPPYEVGREKIREFATAIGEPDPVCHDVEAARAAGHPDLVAPPTFPVVFTMPRIEAFLRDPGFGWRFEGTVHGGQSIEFTRPIHAGDELVTTVEVVSLSTRAGTHMLTVRCACTDQTGQAVCATEALLLSQADGLMAAFAEGDQLPTLRVRLTRTDLLRYAGASGDFNPIHWSDRVATSVQLPGVVAHGMLTMALAGRLVTGWLGDQGAVRSFQVRFTRPVPVPDVVDGVDAADAEGAVVELAGTLKSIETVDGARTGKVDIKAVFAGSTVLGRAVAIVTLPD